MKMTMTPLSLLPPSPPPKIVLIAIVILFTICISASTSYAFTTSYTAINNNNSRRRNTRNSYSSTLLSSLNTSSSDKKRTTIERSESSSNEVLHKNKDKDKNKDTNKNNKPTIAIIGSGAVGCYYAARLYETQKYHLKFHMRGSHYETTKSIGLNITSSILKDVFIPPEEFLINRKDYNDDDNDDHDNENDGVNCDLFTDDTVKQVGIVDWVLVCLKSTSLTSKINQEQEQEQEQENVITKLVTPLLGKQTRVLVIMNGFVDQDMVKFIEQQQQQEGGNNDNDDDDNDDNDDDDNKNKNSGFPILTKCAATYGGMALLCSNRIAPGHIHHSFAGKLTVSLASSNNNNNNKNKNDDDDDDDNQSESHKEAMEKLFQFTKGFEFCYDDNLTRARWTKNVWNLPFNGISVAMGGITIDVIVKDEGLRRLAEVVMDETIMVANLDLESRGFDKDSFLGDTEKKQMMDLSDTMGPYKTSTMLDLVNRRPMEVKYLFRKPIERANELGVPVPTLETLVTMIEAQQRQYDLF